jgi:hypothetical protein
MTGMDAHAESAREFVIPIMDGITVGAQYAVHPRIAITTTTTMAVARSVAKRKNAKCAAER